MSYLTKLKGHKKLWILKTHRAKSEFFLTYNRFWCLTKATDQGCLRMEPTLLTSAEELYQSALTIWPRNSSCELIRRKYIDRLSNSVATRQTIIDEQRKTRVLIVRLNAKRLLNSNSGIFFFFYQNLNWKNKFLLQKIQHA